MMKRTVLIALGLAMLPLGAMAQADTATLLSWQQSHAPVVLVEEIIEPGLCCTNSAGKPLLAVRVLAGDASTCIEKGTLLILDTANIAPATNGIARRWILNLAGLENLRSLHARSEVLHATAPDGVLSDAAGVNGFTDFRQKNQWHSICSYLKHDISPEEIRRIPIICRENFTPSLKRYERDGRHYQQFRQICDIAMPEPWCKGYQPGERIIIHWPEEEATPDQSSRKALEEKMRHEGSITGTFFLTDRFERQGNTLHLYADCCRRVSGHAGNTEKLKDILQQNKEQVVQIKTDESSPYLPHEDSYKNAKDIDFNCHRIYTKVREKEIVVRCKEIQRRIGDFTGSLAGRYKWCYITAEVEEVLKGSMRKGTRLAYWKSLESCDEARDIRPVENSFYMGMNERDMYSLPTEQVQYLGAEDFRYTIAGATPSWVEAMQKVQTEYPEIFDKPRPSQPMQSIDTEQARQIALKAIREQEGHEITIPYNVQGYGRYLLVYPAASHRGQGPAVILHPDGRVARIFHFDPDSNI